MTITVQFRVEEPSPPIYDDRGRRCVLIHEVYEGPEHRPEDRLHRVPGIVYLRFIEARRAVVRHLLAIDGYTPSEPAIDWSFLEKGTKQ